MESIVINGVDPLHRIFVGTQEEKNVWVNLIVPGGSAYMRISPESAQQMIEALQQAIEVAKNEA
jgi:hypothetical protein